jgi:hypothetical protein
VIHDVGAVEKTGQITAWKRQIAFDELDSCGPLRWFASAQYPNLGALRNKSRDQSRTDESSTSRYGNALGHDILIL